MPVVLLLLVFWFYLAYQALLRGDTTRAIIYIAVGLALTVYRLRKREPAPK
ncbi:MAG TPA: hypothetical protein VF836_08795 [Gemmatimonadaceae bacterium]